MRAAIVFAAAVVLAACGRGGNCSTAADCTDAPPPFLAPLTFACVEHAATGNRWCAFADNTCSGSGERWASAGDGLHCSCVAAGADGGAP